MLWPLSEAIKASGPEWQTWQMITSRWGEPPNVVDPVLLLLLVQDRAIEVKGTGHGKKGYREPVKWYRARELDGPPDRSTGPDSPRERRCRAYRRG